MKICILAAGTWGTALAKVLCDKNDVIVWSYNKEEVEYLNTYRKHKNLKEVLLPDNIVFTNDLNNAIKDSQIVIIATPSVFVRETCEKIKNILKDQIIVSVAKGIETKTLFTMSEVIEDVLGSNYSVVSLSGPTHAEEVAKNIPTLIVSSSKNQEAARVIQKLFVGTCIRPYTNNDIKGIELCGSLKNIVALACGISSGLGYGDNTKAAIITRGMSEIRNLGRMIGCNEDTFSGLAGIGDLIVTATSQHSRNNKCGYLIGQGYSVDDAIKEVKMVVEGLNALPAAIELSKKYDCELPIINAVNEIVQGRLNPKEVLIKLFSREIKAELYYENELYKK